MTDAQGPEGGSGGTRPEKLPAVPPPEETRVDLVIRTYFEEPLLWPVLVAGILIFASFGAAILLFAVVDRRPPAMGALLLLVFLSLRAVGGDLRRRRFGPVCWLVAGLWSGCLAIAAGLTWLGVF